MTFPTIPTVAANTLIESTQATATTTHTFGSLTTLDNASGDLLIAVIVLYQASATANGFSSWGGGFTEFGDSSSATNPSMAMGCAYKISDGTETGTFTVTSSISGRSAMYLMSIKNWHGTTVPEVAFSAATTTTAQDPPSLDPTGWGAEDTLWIAVAAGGQTSLTGTWTGLTSAPANYTDYAESAISGGDVIGACQIAVAFRGNNTAAEDPGSFTTDTSPEIERAATIAVRPTSAVTVTPSAIAVTVAVPQATATELTKWRANGNHYDSVSAVTDSGTLTVPTGVIAADHALVVAAWSVSTTGETPPSISIVNDTGSATWSTIYAARTDNNMGYAVFKGTGAVAADTFHTHFAASATRVIGVAHSYWHDIVDFGTSGTLTERGGVSGATNTAAGLTTTEVSQEVVVVSTERTPTTGTTVSTSGATVTQRDYYETGSTNGCSFFFGSLYGPASPGSTSSVTLTYTHSSGNGGAFQIPLEISVTVAPAVITTTAALPAAGVTVEAVPAAVAATVALPQATADTGSGGNATATPGAVSSVVALPAAAVNVGAAPAVTSTIVAAPQAAVSVAAAPAQVAAIVALPKADVAVAAVPAVFAAITALPQAAVSVAAAPSAIPVVVSLPQATPDTGGTNATVTPARIVTTVSLPQAAMSVGAAPAQITAVVNLPAAAVSVAATPTVVPVTVALPQASIIVNATQQPATIQTIVTIPAAAVSVGAAPATIPVTVSFYVPETGARINAQSTATLTAGRTSSPTVLVSIASVAAVSAASSSTSSVLD